MPEVVQQQPEWVANASTTAGDAIVEVPLGVQEKCDGVLALARGVLGSSSCSSAEEQHVLKRSGTGPDVEKDTEGGLEGCLEHVTCAGMKGREEQVWRWAAVMQDSRES